MPNYYGQQDAPQPFAEDALHVPQEPLPNADYLPEYPQNDVSDISWEPPNPDVAYSNALVESFEGGYVAGGYGAGLPFLAEQNETTAWPSIERLRPSGTLRYTQASPYGGVEIPVNLFLLPIVDPR